jgi:hypothetical protein
LHNPQNYIFSLALNLGTYTPYLLSVVVYSRKRRKKEIKRIPKHKHGWCGVDVGIIYV